MLLPPWHSEAVRERVITGRRVQLRKNSTLALNSAGTEDRIEAPRSVGLPRVFGVHGTRREQQ